jgi:hypothetical protein
MHKLYAWVKQQSSCARTQKKMYIPSWKYTIIMSCHEHTSRGRGASEGCRPKLPRWPCSHPAAPVLGVRWTAVWYASRARRVKLFVRSRSPRMVSAPIATSRLSTPVMSSSVPASHFQMHSVPRGQAEPRAVSGLTRRPARHTAPDTGVVPPLRTTTARTREAGHLVDSMNQMIISCRSRTCHRTASCHQVGGAQPPPQVSVPSGAVRGRVNPGASACCRLALRRARTAHRLSRAGASAGQNRCVRRVGTKNA